MHTRNMLEGQGPFFPCRDKLGRFQGHRAWSLDMGEHTSMLLTTRMFLPEFPAQEAGPHPPEPRGLHPTRKHHGCLVGVSV